MALNLAAKVAVEASARQEAAAAAASDAARPMSAARDQPMMPPKADTSGLDEQTAAEVKQVCHGMKEVDGQNAISVNPI